MGQCPSDRSSAVELGSDHNGRQTHKGNWSRLTVRKPALFGMNRVGLREVIGSAKHNRPYLILSGLSESGALHR